MDETLILSTPQPHIGFAELEYTLALKKKDLVCCIAVERLRWSSLNLASLNWTSST
jgi:hypothetical protein